VSDTLIYNDEIGLELWRAAAQQEIGIRFTFNINDMGRLKTFLYAVRKNAPDYEELKELMLCTSPGGKELWMVRPPKDEAP
jgi:hypothetical protein